MKVHISGTKEEIQAKKSDIVKALIRDLKVDVDSLVKAEPHGEDPLSHKTIRDLHHMEKAIVDEEYQAMLKEIEKLLNEES